MIIRVFVHKLQNRRKAARGFFTRLGDRPQPRHVDVRVADAARNHVVVSRKVGVDRFFKICGSRAHGSVKFLAVWRAQVKQVYAFVQRVFQQHAVSVFLFHARKRLDRHFQVIIQRFNLRVNLLNFHKEIEFVVDGAGVRLQVEHELFTGGRFRGKQHVAVVHVHALHGHVVRKQQKLRVFAVIAFDLRAHI